MSHQVHPQVPIPPSPPGHHLTGPPVRQTGSGGGQGALGTGRPSGEGLPGWGAVGLKAGRRLGLEDVLPSFKRSCALLLSQPHNSLPCADIWGDGGQGNRLPACLPATRAAGLQALCTVANGQPSSGWLPYVPPPPYGPPCITQGLPGQPFQGRRMPPHRTAPWALFRWRTALSKTGRGATPPPANPSPNLWPFVTFSLPQSNFGGWGAWGCLSPPGVFLLGVQVLVGCGRLAFGPRERLPGCNAGPSPPRSTAATGGGAHEGSDP